MLHIKRKAYGLDIYNRNGLYLATIARGLAYVVLSKAAAGKKVVWITPLHHARREYPRNKRWWLINNRQCAFGDALRLFRQPGA